MVPPVRRLYSANNELRAQIQEFQARTQRLQTQLQALSEETALKDAYTEFRISESAEN